MTNKYLFMADVHLSNKLPYSMPVEDSRITDRFADQLQMLEDIADIGAAEKVDGYFILGDLFDKSTVDPVTFFEAARVIQNAFEAPVYVLPGNHDSVTISGGPYITDIFSLLGVQILTHELCITDEFVNFLPLEYLSVDDSLGPIEELRKKCVDGKNNVLLFHNTVVGAKQGGYVSENGFNAKELLGDFDLALGGHFHERQEVVEDLLYIGAPMQHHFGDCGNDVGVSIFEFGDNSSYKECRKSVLTPKFYQYKNPDEIDWVGREGDYIRLTVECTVAELHERAHEIKEWQGLAKDYGVHFFFQHVPVYQHDLRLDMDRSELSYRALLEEYVNTPDVKTGKINKKKLVQYGQDMLEKAVKKNGNN